MLERRVAMCLLLSSLAMGLGACLDECHNVECAACPDAVTVHVVAADAQPLADVTTTKGYCVDWHDGSFSCMVDGPPGIFEFTIAAPGYAAKTVTVEVAAASGGGGGCCEPCEVLEQYVDLTLDPL